MTVAHPPVRPTASIAVFLGVLSAVPLALAQPAPHKEFPIGRLQSLGDLPASRLRTDLEKLPPAARQRARDWLRDVHFTEADLPSLHTDSHGGICYACQFGKPPTAVQTAAAEPETPLISAAAVPVSPYPAGLVFHSRPGAPNVLYINFTGETVTGTQWNTEINRTSIPAVAFSTDADLTTFSDTEQTAIKHIWQRMAEDYAPFNIDVTTERPAAFTTRTAMALITRSTDANGALNPSGTAGGVAYLNVFGLSIFAQYRPAWVYYDRLNNSESNIAEAASHEIGHNLGLSHDGTSSLEYYGGHGSDDISWGPLMGTGYSRNVSQWSKGEYYLANNTQDDLATIAAKISYRPDDHGNTAATATRLVVTGGTRIVATTPENDPANTDTANKGVLAGPISTNVPDEDVFSFVTGSGAVTLTANPWITPTGLPSYTRGGNLDILLELRDQAGRPIASNNSSSLTQATLQTTLTAGLYFLHVRNSATGNPTVPSPTGYTAYGSLGQYFIDGTIIDPAGAVIPPAAAFEASNLTQVGQSSHTFTVTYFDDLEVAVAGIDSNDLQVTGPGGYSQLAQFVSVSSATNGSPRTATYSVRPAAGGNWAAAQNGTYTVSMQTGQVADTGGAFAPAGELGQFQIALPAPVYATNLNIQPGWTMESMWQHGPPNYGTNSSAPATAFTGTKIIGFDLSGNYSNGLTTKYATTPPIDCSGTTALTLHFMRWLRIKSNDVASIQYSTNGTAWTTVWSSSSALQDNTWQSQQVALPAGAVGSPSLQLRWGISSNNSQNDIGWNIDDVEILSDLPLDINPPLAGLSVADISLQSAASHACSVVYSDHAAVRLSSLGASDLVATGPGGYSAPLAFVGANQSEDNSSITGSYTIPAPGGSWDSTDNGSYAITLQAAAVEDTVNNTTQQTVLGTFNVSIAPPSPGVLAVTPAEDFSVSGTAGGPFNPGSTTYTLTNQGELALEWSANKEAGWVSLDTNGGNLAPGASTNVTVSINEAANTLAAGAYGDTVVFANTTSGNGNAIRSVSLEVTEPLNEAPPKFASTAVGGAGLFQMVIHGSPGTEVVVEACADFTHWTTIATVEIGNDGTATVTDPDSANLPARFYRMRTNP